MSHLLSICLHISIVENTTKCPSGVFLRHQRRISSKVEEFAAPPLLDLYLHTFIYKPIENEWGFFECNVWLLLPKWLYK